MTRPEIVDTILIIATGEYQRLDSIPQCRPMHFRVGPGMADIGVLTWDRHYRFGLDPVYLPKIKKLDGQGWILEADTMIQPIVLHLNSAPFPKTIDPPKGGGSWADAICGNEQPQCAEGQQ